MHERLERDIRAPLLSYAVHVFHPVPVSRIPLPCSILFLRSHSLHIIILFQPPLFDAPPSYHISCSIYLCGSRSHYDASEIELHTDRILNSAFSKKIPFFPNNNNRYSLNFGIGGKVV